MKSLSHALFVKLSVTLWAIWVARRKAIHEGIFQSPQTIHSFINRFIDKLDMIKENQPVPNQGLSSAPEVTTHRPKAQPLGYCKIHVDAGVRQGREGSTNNEKLFLMHVVVDP